MENVELMQECCLQHWRWEQQEWNKTIKTEEESKQKTVNVVKTEHEIKKSQMP